MNFMQEPYTSVKPCKNNFGVENYFTGVGPHQNNFPTRGQVPNNYFGIIFVEPIAGLLVCVHQCQEKPAPVFLASMLVVSINLNLF